MFRYICRALPPIECLTITLGITGQLRFKAHIKILVCHLDVGLNLIKGEGSFDFILFEY